MANFDTAVPDQVRAAVTHPDGVTTIESFPSPRLGDDDGLLRVEASGICGTDVALAQGGRLAGPTILGHHVVGRVVALGSTAKHRWDVEVGDRVAIQEYLPCHACRWCEVGEYRMCARTDFRTGGRRIGTVPVSEAPSLWGGNADYTYLPAEALVHRIPDGISASQAVWLLPLANAFDWTVESGGTTAGSSVVVIGPGQHGLTCIVAAREAGAAEVVIVGRPGDEPRLDLAVALGATATVIDRDGDDLAGVREVLGADGADVVVNTSGAGPELFPELIALAGKRGTIVETGVSDGLASDIDLQAVTARALRLVGVRGRSLTAIDRAMASLGCGDGQHPLERVPSDAIDLADLDGVFRPSADAPSRAVHTIVTPKGGPPAGGSMSEKEPA